MPEDLLAHWSVRCLWILSGLQALLGGIAFLDALGHQGAVIAALMNLLGGLLVVSSVAGILGGLLWARRMLMLAHFFSALMFAILLVFLPDVFGTQDLLLQVADLGQFGLQSTALMLLFSRNLRHWLQGRLIRRRVYYV
jgi:hypothetical protein